MSVSTAQSSENIPTDVPPEALAHCANPLGGTAEGSAPPPFHYSDFSSTPEPDDRDLDPPLQQGEEPPSKPDGRQLPGEH